MQATEFKTTYGLSIPYSNGIPTKKGFPIRNKEKKENYGAQWCRNAFLKTIVAPYAKREVVCYQDDNSFNCLTNENYEYLRDSALHYATLLGVELNHTPGKSIGESIARLYNDLDSIIGQLSLNIEIHDNKLVFIIWEAHKWEERCFYWIPVNFVHRLTGKLRRISVSFLHEFAKSNGTSTIYNCGDTEMTLDYLWDGVCYIEDKTERHEKSCLLKSYTSGPICRLFIEIDEKSYYKNLRSAIDHYKPENKYESSLIKFFQEGLQFIGDSSPSIMNYNYDPYSEKDSEEWPVELDRIFRLHYDDDWFNKQMQEFISEEANMNYSMIPITHLTLSPDMKSTFSKDDYPERLGLWIMDFAEFLYDN